MKIKEICVTLIVINIALMFLSKNVQGLTASTFLNYILTKIGINVENHMLCKTISFFMFLCINIVAIIFCLMEKYKVVLGVNIFNSIAIVAMYLIRWMDYKKTSENGSIGKGYFTSMVNTHTVFVLIISIVIIILSFEKRDKNLNSKN